MPNSNNSGVPPEDNSTVLFIKALFGVTTEQPVFLCTLPNISGDPNEPGPRQILTREADKALTFVKRWDRKGRGLFFCVGTVTPGARRAKDTILESTGLHADIDFKLVDADEPTIREKLFALRLPPSALVRSGHGLHVYWLFKEGLASQEHQERIEAALRQLADIVAGDLAVAEMSRLMRLPGSHNSKNGDWREVICEFSDGPRYELDDLEEWLSETAPVLRRKATNSTQNITENITASSNPFLEAARLQGFKPALDVEKSLGEMALGNVHSTQLAVSASLLNAGQDTPEVVNLLLHATRAAAGDVGQRWNWRREEKKLTGMCLTWIKKKDQSTRTRSIHNVSTTSATSPEMRQNVSEKPEQVVNLGAERALRAKLKPGPNSGKPKLHIVLGEAFLAGMRAEGLELKFTPEGDYRYSGGLWRLDGDIATWLNGQLEIAARALSMDSNIKLINEARAWLLRHPALRTTDAVAWDRHGQIPTMSGLVHPLTGVVTPALPEHLVTWRIEAPYDPAAACPWWLQMLEDTFADRPADVRASLVQLIQEVLGAGLIDERSKALSRALIFQGGTDHGKSGMVAVLGGLFGKAHNTTALSALENPHGTTAFAWRRPWVLDEAFDASKWHPSATVKAIISGDNIQINVKNGRIYSHRFTAPIFWGTNPSVQFKEATEAIINRILVIECRRRFDDRQPVGAAVEARRRRLKDPSAMVLRDELPGLLVWAVGGLRRALGRGYFDIPDETREAGQAVRLDSNRVAGFVRDCITFDPDRMVSTPDFSLAVASWFIEHKGEDRHVPSSDSIGRDMKALSEPRIAMGMDLRSNARRYYAGFELNAEGLRHFKNGAKSQVWQLAGRKASTSAEDDDPNRQIPLSWDTKSAIRAMREAHAKMAESGDTSVTHDTSRGDTSDTSDFEVSATQMPDSPNEPPF